MRIADALQQSKITLQQNSDTPSLDAQVLLAHIFKKPRAWVLAYPETQLTPRQEQQLAAALTQLATATPLPYILGHWEFYGLDFTISPSVLIPRPETELLIAEALDWLKTNPDKRRVADMGTGSGCIAVTLAKHIPNLHVAATDISEKALQIAHANARKHQVTRQIEFAQGDLFSPLSSPLDLICANLPYIPTATLQSLDVYRREPTLALDGGPDGLNIIRTLITEAPQYLAPGGLLILEIGSSQGVAALSLAQAAFPHANVRLLPDLTGRDRLIRIET